MRNISYIVLVCLAFWGISCQQDVTEIDTTNGRMELRLQGCIEQQHISRANDSAFSNGDVMGIYVVDYSNGEAGQITDADLRASNMLYTYNLKENSWQSPGRIYWKDANTPVDIYAYYPGVTTIETPDSYEFEVQYKQNSYSSDGKRANYEVSDFLWGKATKVEPTENYILVNLHHRMAGVNVSLVRGNGMTNAEWELMEKIVLIDNTVRHAVIDLSEGVPMPKGDVDRSIVMRKLSDTNYKAVVVPQTVAAGKSLISVTIDGQTYTHRLTTDMVYNMGKLHNFTLTINRKESSGDFECTLACDGITDWQADESIYDYDSNSYVVVEVTEAGQLKQKIAELGIDPAKIENLKLVGQYNHDDFDYIHDTMFDTLCGINLSDASFVHVLTRYGWDNEEQNYIYEYHDDYLPNEAFASMPRLQRVILPKNLKHIGVSAFRYTKLTSTLFIPEGVTHIHEGAFYAANCNIELPLSLEYIDRSAFDSPEITGEFRLTDNVKHIGDYAFHRSRFHGSFYLPSHLEHLGECAFYLFGKDMTGDIIIPTTIKEIPSHAFSTMGFANGTNLILHEAVEKIGTSAFMSTQINNSLKWPTNLKVIGRRAFYYSNMIIPELTLPQNIVIIGPGAFYHNYLGGEIKIPDGLTILDSSDEYGIFGNNQIESVTIGNDVEFVGDRAFENNLRLRRLSIGKNVDYIGDRAFAKCRALQTVSCFATTPPVLGSNVFANGVYFDQCVLQVPEESVELYRNTDIWNQFDNITAYKELAFDISDIVTMDKGITRQGIIRAEGPWEVIEAPEWVSISPASGDGKAEITVTIKAQSTGAPTREGKIVFKLIGQDFTTYTTVRQVGYEYHEDQTIILQEASAGAHKAIPLFIVGDGYSADDIASGLYLEDMKQQMEYFFSIEPLKSYRDYFTVSTAFAVSPDSGLTGINKFDTVFDSALAGNSHKVKDYARKYGAGVADNESSSTILVLVNTSVTNNTIDLLIYEPNPGLAIAYMGKSTFAYPYDQQGCVLNMAGQAFGKLGPEGIKHMTFIDACTCGDCNMNKQYENAQRLGWWQNLAKTNKITQLPWYHLIFHEKYAGIVDVFEGGCNHARGVYRSENQSVMGDGFVRYFNTFSREIIVRRIMECSGEEFSFDQFVANDKIELPE